MRRSRRALTRSLTWGLLGGIVLVLSGDRGAWTSNHQGQDPLEILNLQVRANAIVVLDSSGSMQELLNQYPTGGDHAGSKLYQAKAVLSQVIRDNERKVSFQFGQYEQPGIGGQSASVMSIPATGTERFLYTTTSDRDASMLTNEMTVDLRSYVVPAGARIRFREGGTDYSPVVTATTTRYATGVELANVLAAVMSAAGPTNDYTVNYLDTHRFQFVRSSGGATFGTRWSQMTSGADNTLRQELGSNTTDQTGGTSYTASGTAQGDIDFRRRSNMDSLAADGVRHYKAYARRFFNGQTLVVRQGGAAATNGNVVCSVTPGLGTTGVGGDGTLSDPANPASARNQPWVELVRADDTCAPMTGANAQTVRLSFASVPRGDYDDTYVPGGGEWRTWGSSTTCGGFESLVELQDCTNNAQLNLVSPFLEPEIRIDPATRWPYGYAENADGSLTATGQPDVGGIRGAGMTPIAETIADVDAAFTTSLWPTISAYGGGTGPFPKTFLIFLTDGDDTCETANGGGSLSDERLALRAAHRAQLLYQSIDTSNAPRRVASSVTTFVVAFGQGVSVDKANWIAWGGSGLTRGTYDNGGSIGLRWQDWPGATVAERSAAALDYKNLNCPNCQDALVASDASELGKLLQIAIDQGQAVGTFSDQQSVTDSIFELAYVAGYDPRNPLTRYRASVPVLLQSTFGMPDFMGRLKAFRRGVAASVEEWDAGTKLRTRLVNGAFGTDGMGAASWSYGELRGGGTDATILSSTARIKRRIYTTNGNGVFLPSTDDLLDGVSPGRLTLWPAEPSVDPAGSGGVLDEELGIAAPVTFTQLQTLYGACLSYVAADLPADCTAATGRAVMEARRIILASMAGADLVKNGNLPVRRPADKELLFRVRPWALAESTLAAPAVVGPPPPEPPGEHSFEYNLFVNGPRDGGTAVNAIALGFGLRDPDKDTTADANDPRQQLKPVMSVAYHAANDMLHAFRAGACRDNSGNTICLDNTSESGGEELWGFVPYDVLGTLRRLLVPQTRADHTFMLATPVRFSQVFVPGPWSRSVGGVALSGDGLWRNVLIFGRGIAGKHLTAIDVTTPGPFTQGSLSATGPIALWNRGNPDTVDGLPTGSPNNTISGNADAAAYAEMGETWSVPAVAFVRAEPNVTPRKPNGVAFVAYVGSGYSDVATEGKRFYALDLLTGDVIASTNVGNRAVGLPPFENSLVSGPVAFNELSLSNRDTAVNPAEVVSTRVYFNDLHGRLFRVMTDAPGIAVQIADVNDTSSAVLHPLGVPPALVFYGQPSAPEYPHIFIESGNDNRIFSPEAIPATTPPFKAWGLIDEDLSSDPDSTDGVAGPVRVAFTKDFPNLYRGTTQPATAFHTGGLARVFFAGTRYNPPGTQFAPPPYPCRSSFDSILFALGAGTGNAAYDLNASGQDEYIEYINQQVKSVQVVGGQVIVDRGLNAEIVPTPPPSNTISPPVEGSVYQGLNVPGQFVVSHRETPFLGGTAVCR